MRQPRRKPISAVQGLRGAGGGTQRGDARPSAPTPTFEKIIDNHTITPAAAASPNDSGESRRASTASTTTLRTARMPLPIESHTKPLNALCDKE
jgi:hypothetical protein